MVQDFGGRAAFVSENYGDSKLARRFGVTRYPAIFVDDVLVATPNDFGFYGKGEKEEGGRYSPLQSAETHDRFRSDLSRMIRLTLAGRREDARALAAPAPESSAARLPAVPIIGLDGRPVASEELAGRVVLVEFWATWCPPCRSTLRWVGELKKRYGDRLEVVAIAVESEEAGVRRLANELQLPLRWAMGSPEIVRAFGDVGAVPTLLLFDRSGGAAGAFYGAPPSLHAEAEAKVASLLQGGVR